ncbi:hypothetical protein Fot_37787 [Forsythia ovata]|uniref:Uncharacterized protein n=1 Tax=Forsythia ovata TaxID=205694 RepID=A0ABD1RZZ0_9LAMI
MDPSSETSNTEYGTYSGVHCPSDRGSGWGVLSSLPKPGTASVPMATVPSMTGVVGGDSSSIPFEAPVRPSEDVDHQGKGKWVAIDEWERVAPKRTLGDEGDAVGSVRFKRGRMAPPQEIA